MKFIIQTEGTSFSSFILALRDGVTGNTSGFELEDEGSIPSPAAISLLEFAKGISIVTKAVEV